MRRSRSWRMKMKKNCESSWIVHCLPPEALQPAQLSVYIPHCFACMNHITVIYRKNATYAASQSTCPYQIIVANSLPLVYIGTAHCIMFLSSSPSVPLPPKDSGMLPLMRIPAARAVGRLCVRFRHSVTSGPLRRGTLASKTEKYLWYWRLGVSNFSVHPLYYVVYIHCRVGDKGTVLAVARGTWTSHHRSAFSIQVSLSGSWCIRWHKLKAKIFATFRPKK